MKNEVIILEKSTNTHVTKSNVVVEKEFPEMTTIVLNTNGNCIVEHGHHATVATEAYTKQVIKITQQESNPVERKYMNAMD